jgi:hypothetical protein
MRNVTETVKQLIIINVLFFIGTLVVGDPTYKMLAMFFLRMTAFNYGSLFAYVYARWVYAHLFNMFALYSLVGLESFWEVKVFILLYFLWFRRRIDAYRN